MKKLSIVLSLLALCIWAPAQDGKPWTEWTKKDAEKILNESSWGQTYLFEQDASGDSGAVTNTRGGVGGERRGESGEARPSGSVRYRARLLSAKPVREAFGRIVVLQQTDAPGDLKSQLQSFIDRDFGDFLIVAVNIESQNARLSQSLMGMLSRLNVELLKDRVYMERKDGKRAQLIDYRPPVDDGMGAKFIFSKTLDGQPFLNEASDFLRFYLELNSQQKLNMKFKVSGMTYAGKLEY